MNHLPGGPIRRLAPLLVLSMLAGGAPVQDPPAFLERADELWARLTQLRAESGRTVLERRPKLDELALKRARDLATLPELNRQMGLPSPIDRFFFLEAYGGFRRAAEHVDLKKGYRDPSEAFQFTWVSSREARALALDPGMNGVGIAMVQADDGWVIMNALFVEDLIPPSNLIELEQEALKEINAIRRGRGLPELIPSQPLTEVARAHSEDMANRGFFDHKSPEGTMPADRMQARGIVYRSVAENIQFNNDQDPAGKAVEEWMKSTGHRRNILTSRFNYTGIGVAVDEFGNVYFTQLFLETIFRR